MLSNKRLRFDTFGKLFLLEYSWFISSNMNLEIEYTPKPRLAFDSYAK
jgi:hypothetical protein